MTPPDNRLISVFTPFPRFAIEPARTALVVIDMQYADAHPEHGIGRTARDSGASEMFADYWPAVERAVACQQKLIEAAHVAGIQTIFTRIATQTRDGRDVGRQHALVGLIVPRDSVDACLLEQLPVGPDDLVISNTGRDHQPERRVL